MVKNKSKCGLSWSVLLPTTSMCHYSFPKHFLRIVYIKFCILSEFVKVSERKVWRVQAANLHNAARALLSSSRCFQLSRRRFTISFVIFGIVVKKQIECGLAWSVLLSTTIRVITVVKMARIVVLVQSYRHALCKGRHILNQLCNKLSYITKRALCFSYWVRQQHTPMGK